MSNCGHKYTKWLPHNWLCLRGLSFFFLGFFYLAFCYAIYQTIYILIRFSGAEIAAALAYYVLSDLAAAIIFLTIAKALGALRAIKQAVAPCGCSTEKTTEEAK